MNLTDTLDQKWPKNLKPETFYIFLELKSDIPNSTNNIVKKLDNNFILLIVQPRRSDFTADTKNVKSNYISCKFNYYQST